MKLFFVSITIIKIHCYFYPIDLRIERILAQRGIEWGQIEVATLTLYRLNSITIKNVFNRVINLTNIFICGLNFFIEIC